MITPDQLAASGSEHGLQCALFCWRNQQVNNWREIYDANLAGKGGSAADLPNLADKLELMFAIPNGGARHAAVASKLKAEGVKAGVPDILLPAPPETNYNTKFVQRFHGLFIELKQQKYRNRARGGCSEEQAAMIDALREQGYCVAICYTWQEARDAILQYLGTY